MHVFGSSYTWFIFNLNTKQCYSQTTYNDTLSHRYICTRDDSLSIHPLLFSLTSTFPFLQGPTSPFYLLGRFCFFCSWCEYPSTLVPGLLSTVLPLLLRPPQGTPQIKLHIYIDDINNISRPVWYSSRTFGYSIPYCLGVIYNLHMITLSYCPKDLNSSCLSLNTCKKLANMTPNQGGWVFRLQQTASTKYTVWMLCIKEASSVTIDLYIMYKNRARYIIYQFILRSLQC